MFHRLYSREHAGRSVWLCWRQLGDSWAEPTTSPPDGRRFLMIKPEGGTPAPTSLVVVQHWDDELKRRVPTR